MNSNPNLKKNPLNKDVYTLDDLRNWSSDSTCLAVVGSPIKHSLSPQIHNAALSDLSKSHPHLSNWRYVKFEIDPTDLKESLSLFHKHNFQGLNLTVPHKILATHWTNAAEDNVTLTGACNTLKWTPDGYDGYNTDLHGLKTACEIELSARFRDTEILIIGAGGAARAAAVVCLKSGTPALHLANRTTSKAQKIKNELTTHFPHADIQIHNLTPPITIDSQKLLIINATSLGLNSDDPSALDLSTIPTSAKVFDMIYNPPETALIKQAISFGMDTANGLSMLVHQGHQSLKIWTELEPSAEIMKEAAIKGLNQ